tara:strand:+ start:62507 stop:63013 length:507 start_codon:yes stop_codon:yes gene_type:complete
MAMHQANRDYVVGAGLFPPLLLLLLVIIGYILTGIFDALWFKPWLLTIGVFYWTLYFPNSVPIWFSLILGLLEDGLAGTPFGLYGFGIILIHFMAYHQRKSLIYSPFAMVYTGFIINLFVVSVSLTFIMWLIGLPLSYWVAVQWIVTCILFLPISYLFNLLRQKMIKD